MDGDARGAARPRQATTAGKPGKGGDARRRSTDARGDSRSPVPVRLAARHEVPEHLRFNKFILHGYRSPQLTPMQCLKSSTYLHNETVNVVTHLAPLVLSLFLLCSTEYAGRGLHYETARMVTSAGAISMFASVMYHLLMPATASKAQVRRCACRVVTCSRHLADADATAATLAAVHVPMPLPVPALARAPYSTAAC